MKPQNSLMKTKSVESVVQTQYNVYTEMQDRPQKFIGNIKEEELQENSTTEYFSIVQKEGNQDVCRNIIRYNRDTIIAVGYRVYSARSNKPVCEDKE